MDLREIGNLFMVGFHSTDFTGEVHDFLAELNPCGVILFSRNILTPLQTAVLNCDLQRYAVEHLSQGLFIGLDQEGGRVRRLREPFTEFPPALQLASRHDAEAEISRFAEVTAREIRAVGFNLDFVPVLDVLGSQDVPATSVIGDRAYGHEPAAVSRLGSIVIRTMRSSGVIPCCKHFPGHGGTTIDSHLDLPVDSRPIERIESFDLIPFRDAVDSGVEMIMTAHVMYPAWDSTSPATLSPTLIEGILRTGLGYDGVVISDDLDMGAVSRRYSVEESAVQAVAAGVDIPLICNSSEKAFAARSAIYAAWKDGEIFSDRIAKSLNRIRTLKSKFAGSLVPCDVDKFRNQFRA